MVFYLYKTTALFPITIFISLHNVTSYTPTNIRTYIHIYKASEKEFKGYLNEDTICVYVRIIYANRNRTCNTCLLYTSDAADE